MEQKTEAATKTKVLSTNKIEVKVQDDAYRQINATSFQQNFKALIAHYITNGQESRLL